jgi:hypothetical protein
MALYLFDEICTINLEETSRITRGRVLNLNHGYSLACSSDRATNLAINLNTMSEDYRRTFESSVGAYFNFGNVANANSISESVKIELNQNQFISFINFSFSN